MALDITRLKDKLKAAALASYAGTPTGEQEAQLTAYALAVATAVVEEIQAADVSVTVPVDITDTGLQSYTVPPAAPVATTGPLVPTSLDGTGSVS